jgi:hypothetical protein
VKRSGPPARTAWKRLCGKAYPSVDEAERSKAAQRPGAVIDTRCPNGDIHVRQAPAAVPALPARPRATGFSARVKLLVRARAGYGDPEDARCENCGEPLGRYGGQVQHIVARGMGGTSNRVLKTAANGAALCGTSSSGCHGLAEARDPGMRDRGFWLPQGTDPRLEAMTLHTGRRARRTEDGDYLFEAPEAGAA